MPSTRLLALSGILAPLFYVAATWLTVWLRPEYSLVLDSVSQLANVDEPFGILFILAGAVPVGLLMVIFAYSLWSALPERRSMLFGIVLLAHEGIALIVSFGVFPRSGPSPGALHLGAGLYALACGVAARLLLAPSLRSLGRIFFPITVAVAVAIPVLFLGAARFSATPGLYERIAHALLFAWMAALAVPLLLRPEES
jgi:hypothetical membrane protein